MNELLGLAPNCIIRGLRTYVASGAYHNVAMHNPRAAACAKEVREILAMRTSVSPQLARWTLASEGSGKLDWVKACALNPTTWALAKD